MRITIFQQAPDIGGSEIYMANLIRQWVKSGDQVQAFTNYDELKNLFKANGAKVRHLPFILDIIGNTRGFLKTTALLPFALPWYYSRLAGIKKETDVIVVSNFTEKLLLTVLSAKLDIPIVWFEYPPLETLINRNLKIPKYFYRHLSLVPKRIITISKNSQRSLIEETKIAGEKIELIYPGSEVPSRIEEIRARKEAQRWKSKLGIKGKRVIGNISRLALEKGQEYLIRAFVQVKKSIPISRLLIVGRGPDLGRFRQLTQKLGVSSDVHFLGFVKDRNAALAMMDIFVFPAAWELEGFGLALTEAMLMRRPIVAVDFGPTPEIIENGETGVLVPLKNPNKLAHAIVNLLENPELSGRLASQAHRLAKLRFDIEKSATKIHRELETAAASTV